MKVAVVGCGALGSFYGAKLARSGHELHFLARTDFETIRLHGVSIRSKDGDFHIHPHAARAPEDIGVADLVLIGLKTTANHQFPRLLPPLVGPNTAILTLQNGLGNEENLARLFPVRQILGGLCFVCLNRTKPGEIHHIDHGRVVIGEFLRPPEPRTHAITEAFRQAGVPCDITADLAHAHWEKLTWNVPFNGLGVAGAAGLKTFAGEAVDLDQLGPCLTTDRLLADSDWTQLVRNLIAEVSAAADSLGLPLDPSLADIQIDRTRSMGAYKASTLLDFEQGKPMEIDSMFLEPLKQARHRNVAVPRLERLCSILLKLDTSSLEQRMRHKVSV